MKLLLLFTIGLGLIHNNNLPMVTIEGTAVTNKYGHVRGLESSQSGLIEYSCRSSRNNGCFSIKKGDFVTLNCKADRKQEMVIYRYCFVENMRTLPKQ